MQAFLDMLTQLKALWDGSPVIWAVTVIVIPVITFLWGRYHQHQEKRKKAFTYEEQAWEIARNSASEAIEELELTYKGRRIDRLTISQIAIWNDGRGTIRREDIAQTGPLSVRSIGGAKILNAEILHRTRDENGFEIDGCDPRQVTFDLEYADEKDGILVQIWHTGTDDSLRVACTIKGGESAPRYTIRPRVYNKITGRPIDRAMFIDAVLFFMGAAICVYIAVQEAAFPAVLGSVLGLLCGVWSLRIWRNNHLYHIPRALRSVEGLDLRRMQERGSETADPSEQRKEGDV